MLPNDINMLVSYLNTKLRDDDMTLEQILEINDADYDKILAKLHDNDYYFDDVVNQIKFK